MEKETHIAKIKRLIDTAVVRGIFQDAGSVMVIMESYNYVERCVDIAEGKKDFEGRNISGSKGADIVL